MKLTDLVKSNSDITQISNKRKHLRLSTTFRSLFFSLILSFVSCTLIPKQEEAPLEIRKAAYDSAREYIGTPYKDIDCSQLIVNAYHNAVEGTEYELLFKDTTVRYLYERYTTFITDPGIGDLIFMGPEESSDITHVAILDEIKEGSVYFIDSTILPELSINGVSYRSYEQDNNKIKDFGRMLLVKKY